MKITIISLILTLTLLVSCQDKETRVSNPDAANYSKIGKQIPTDLGLSWIEFTYGTKELKTGRGNSLYSLTTQELSSLTTSVDNFNGIAFQYGLDNTGTQHIIAIAIDNTLRLWTDIEGRKYIDTNTGNELTKEEAYAMAERYQDANPTAVWFHFFGSNVMLEVLQVQNLLDVNIIPAFSLDLKPQLLLVAGLPDLSGGRTSTSTPIYDASYPCPTCKAE